MGNNPINGVDPDGALFGRIRSWFAALNNGGYNFKNSNGDWITAFNDGTFKNCGGSFLKGTTGGPFAYAGPLSHTGGIFDEPPIFQEYQINQLGLGFNGAVTYIGAYIEGGYAWKKGDFFGGSFYFEDGDSDGLDASIGVNFTRHFSYNPSFQVSDLRGYSGALQGGVTIFDFGRGGDRVNKHFNDTFDFPGLTYRSKSRGASWSPFPVAYTRIKGYTEIK